MYQPQVRDQKAEHIHWPIPNLWRVGWTANPPRLTGWAGWEIFSLGCDLWASFHFAPKWHTKSRTFNWSSVITQSMNTWVNMIKDKKKKINKWTSLKSYQPAPDLPNRWHVNNSREICRAWTSTIIYRSKWNTCLMSKRSARASSFLSMNICSRHGGSRTVRSKTAQQRTQC